MSLRSGESVVASWTSPCPKSSVLFNSNELAEDQKQEKKRKKTTEPFGHLSSRSAQKVAKVHPTAQDWDNYCENKPSVICFNF